MNPASMVVLAAALVSNGLLAGTFFAFSCAIVPGLRRVDDRTYVTAFRGINRAILNPWFLTVFLAAPLFAVAAVVFRPDGAGIWWPIAGAVAAIATFLITAVVNVPLNQRLDAAEVQTDAAMAAARLGFERRWNTAHLIRTLTSVGSVVFLVLAVLV